jgi:hypothetical protein
VDDRRREGLSAALNIELTRSGGFAGMVRTGSAPDEDVPADLRAPLEALLASSTDPRTPGAPDRFVYTVRRGDREVTVGETALDDEGKRLMQWLLAHR